MIAFAVPGAIRLYRDGARGGMGRAGLLLLGAVFVSISVVHSVFYVELRHRWAIEPLILVLSAAGLLAVRARLTS